MPSAAYDEIADWNEHEFLAGTVTPGTDPLGIDTSTAMLRFTRGRLPAARADAVRLPVHDRCLPAVIVVTAHTDMPPTLSC
jgi:hypothetical protein